MNDHIPEGNVRLAKTGFSQLSGYFYSSESKGPEKVTRLKLANSIEL